MRVPWGKLSIGLVVEVMVLDDRFDVVVEVRCDWVGKVSVLSCFNYYYYSQSEFISDGKFLA